MGDNADEDRLANMPARRRAAMAARIEEAGSDVFVDDDDEADVDLGLDIEVFDETLDAAEVEDIDVPRRDRRLSASGYDIKTNLTRHDAAKRAIERAVARKFPHNPLGKHFDPLIFLSLVAASPRVSLELRVNAAKTVIQYTQPKPPQELHQTIEEEQPIVDKQAIRAKLDQLLHKQADSNDDEENLPDEDRSG